MSKTMDSVYNTHLNFRSCAKKSAYYTQVNTVSTFSLGRDKTVFLCNQKSERIPQQQLRSNRSHINS